MKRIGIDVGGTNTDAALVADGRVVASVKVATTPDVTTGVVNALKELQRSAAVRDVSAVMIGTTHFINAVVQRRDLSRVAALRLAAPATTALEPFCDWPADLRDTVRGGFWIVEGGHEFDGRGFVPLDRNAVEIAAREMKRRNLRAIAVTALFSPIDSSHEREAAEIIRRHHPDALVTCSADLGGIGLLERENAALFNAALGELASVTIEGFRAAVRESGLEADLFITQNDGTVVDAETATKYPVFSFACGATNSMRGAAFLTGLEDAVVADVGGTTTDFGEVRRAFPREANSTVQIGGVRTLFRMPDLISIGLGGGSLVRGKHVGPQSVGYKLPTRAVAFGGDQLTATDLAVASGMIKLGDPARLGWISEDQKHAFAATVRAEIEKGVDAVKVAAGDVILIAVGGASFLVPDDLSGVSRVVRTEHGECANAVGAAIAQISGTVDQVFQDMSRDAALEEAVALARTRAVAAGASPDVEIVELEDLPIPYLPGDARRVRARVVGDILDRLSVSR